jgi:hypothetical protein
MIGSRMSEKHANHRLANHSGRGHQPTPEPFDDSARQP